MDTSDQARQRQLDIYAKTPGADKVMLAVEMAEHAKNIATDGIRSRNPDFSEPEIHQEWLYMLHGELSTRLPHSGTPKAR